jgi:hypothetical protein
MTRRRTLALAVPAAAAVVLAVAPGPAAALRFTTPPGSPFGPFPGDVNPGNPVALAVYDADGDGHADVVTLNGNGTTKTVGVLRGDGAGGFTPSPVLSPVDVSPRELDIPGDAAFADVDGDGVRDVVLGYSRRSPSEPGFGVMHGNGDGTFAPAVFTPLDTDASASLPGLALGDLDGDGHLDLAILMRPTTGQRLRLLLGDGHGGFARHGDPIALRTVSGGTAEVFPQSVHVADVDGDGRPDVLVSRAGLPSGQLGLSVLLGDGQGGATEVAASPFATGGRGAGTGGGGINTTRIRTADLDGDGNLDVVTVNKQKPATATPDEGSVSVLRGDGHGAFAPAPGSPFRVYPADEFIPDPFPNTAAVADLDGDGRPDLAVANQKSKDVALLRGDGGTFALDPLRPALDAGTNAVVRIEAADVDGDGRPDLVAAQQIANRTRLAVLLNAARPTATPSADVLDFGSVPVGERASRTVAVANDGTYPLHVRSAAASDDVYAVDASACTAAPVAPGGRCDVTVGFAPVLAGARPAAVTIDTDADGPAVAVALRGTGSPLPGLEQPPTTPAEPPTPTVPTAPGPAPPAGRPARLTLTARRTGAARVRRGAAVGVRATLRNAGGTSTGAVRVCLDGLRRAVRAPVCGRVAALARGGRTVRTLTVRLRATAPRTAVRLTVAATSSGARRTASVGGRVR